MEQQIEKGKILPFEWNDIIMKELFEAEEKAGRGVKLTRNEILNIGISLMNLYKIPVNFEPYKGTPKTGKCSQLKKYKQRLHLSFLKSLQ
jgi:hypothetical protein